MPPPTETCQNAYTFLLMIISVLQVCQFWPVLQVVDHVSATAPNLRIWADYLAQMRWPAETRRLVDDEYRRTAQAPRAFGHQVGDSSFLLF